MIVFNLEKNEIVGKMEVGVSLEVCTVLVTLPLGNIMM